MRNNAAANAVYVVKASPIYPAAPPFHPDQVFPEYPFGAAISDQPNPAYTAVRQLWHELGFDAAHFGAADWNPLGELAARGQTVLLKPNWVYHAVCGPEGHRPENILDVLITHTAVIRAVVDYAYKAVGPTGRIILADAPIQGADFDLLLARAKIPELIAFCRSWQVPLEVLDLRLLRTRVENGRLLQHEDLAGDPRGYVQFNLDEQSALAPLDRVGNHAYRVSDYAANETVQAHGAGRHRYLVARSVLAADLIVNLPKLKTHIKTGLTGALKNLVGINGNKAHLPHFRLGSPAEGGDGYPSRNTWLHLKARYQYQISHWPSWVRALARPLGQFFIGLESRLRSASTRPENLDVYSLSGGSWHGNDTAWRMVIDLNRALRFSDLNGQLQKTVQRRWISIVDGLVAGEGNGPLSPARRPLGYLVAGFDPLAVDAVCARLIGFDWRKLALLRGGAALLSQQADLDTIQVTVDGVWQPVTQLRPTAFRPPDGWRGNVEL